MKINEIEDPQKELMFGVPMSKLTSPKGGRPAFLFTTALGSKYIMTSDGMALRNKSSGHDTEYSPGKGLQPWADKVMFVKDESFLKLLKAFVVGNSSIRNHQRGVTVKFIHNHAIIGVCIDKWYDATYKMWDHVAAKKLNRENEVITSVASLTPKIGYHPMDYNVGQSGEMHGYHPGNKVTNIMRL